jgi:hypothetical protein
MTRYAAIGESMDATHPEEAFARFSAAVRK